MRKHEILKPVSGHKKLIEPRIQGWTSKANIFNTLTVVGYGNWQLALNSVEVCKRVLNLTEVFWRPVALHIIGSKESRSIKKSSVHLKVSVNHTGKSQHRNVSIYFMAAFPCSQWSSKSSKSSKYYYTVYARQQNNCFSQNRFCKVWSIRANVIILWKACKHNFCWSTSTQTEIRICWLGRHLRKACNKVFQK